MLQGNIVRLLIGQFLSQVGDWVAYVALPLVVLAKTGSPVLVSFSLLFEMLPAFIVGPVAGVVVDRYNRRTIMLLSDFVRAALLVVMALTDQLWLLLTAAFLVGAVSQFFVLRCRLLSLI
ncbi:MAG: MFS transporter [Firmicutes bacterium]|nr:MFS transporter [Bacillota bacterium]